MRSPAGNGGWRHLSRDALQGYNRQQHGIFGNRFQEGSNMKAVICEEPGRLVLIERPRPEPKPGEVAVRIRRVGICGTDFHIFGGQHPFLEYPRVMGHELSGTVESVPEGSALSPRAERLYRALPELRALRGLPQGHHQCLPEHPRAGRTLRRRHGRGPVRSGTQRRFRSARRRSTMRP